MKRTALALLIVIIALFAYIGYGVVSNLVQYRITVSQTTLRLGTPIVGVCRSRASRGEETERRMQTPPDRETSISLASLIFAIHPRCVLLTHTQSESEYTDKNPIRQQAEALYV
ncbi:MAG: hypothetical protein AUG17_04635 [Crenarchaeota archaeon 13_1_20CM_2_53_14]|nr:MAG: hypothetical protein AUI07_09155 [archaeon 13_2_20CM_2_53_6]OLE59025.1 MAG: hypothetical protein AUG17_04635 [Crenarchaeota archaeon 13_1_20CM_2_53_14]